MKYMITHVCHPFSPVWDSESRVLILGSFPSVRSREEGFYYGHPRNRFWPMLERIYGVTLDSIEARKSFLLEHRIALWDSIAECDIEGSGDSTIRNVRANDIAALVSASSVRRILANGTSACNVYMKYVYPDTGLGAVRLPSTSPANAAWRLEDLIRVWSCQLPPV